MYYQNKNVEQVERISDKINRSGYLRLDLNENPGGLPIEFIREVLEEVTPEFLSMYPEVSEFTEILSKFLGTDSGHICLVNGSSEGIRNIIEAFSSPSGKIVGVTPSYAMFEVYAKMYGRNFIPVHYTDELQMPVEKILEQMTPDVELLILVNPNNPIGNVYTDEEMQKVLRAAKENEITVLIDEAYFYFYSDTYIKYALDNEHVFITRTFSKLFSLAGCRLGYVVGWPEGIKLVQNLCTSRNINAFGMKFARAIIEKDGMLEGMIEAQHAGKQYLVDELTKKGYKLSAKEGNFVFIKPKTDAETVKKKMQEEGILIKTYAGVGNLGTCLRVTTGERQYMERFLEALYKLDRQSSMVSQEYLEEKC